MFTKVECGSGESQEFYKYLPSYEFGDSYTNPAHNKFLIQLFLAGAM